MTGRRSHGRLSALNGVVHQGSGAPQLAQVLQAQVKENPDRFARLSLKFPTDANHVYVERTLDALKNATGASDLKLQVCSKAFAESRGPCGKSIADVLGGVEDPTPRRCRPDAPLARNGT